MGWKSIQDLMVECYKWLEQNSQFEGIPTGFPELDKMIAGLGWGELVVIGGRPEMGKTALALDFARHAALHARDKVSVAILSLDDPEDLIVRRLLAAESRVELHRILTGALLSGKRWQRLAESAGLLAESGIVIDHVPGVSLRELRERCSRAIEQQFSLDMIIIDPLQAMEDWHEAMGNKRKFYELMEGLNNLAGELDVALIVVSDLGGDIRRQPILSDFLEYGPVEMLKFDNMEADVIPVEAFPLVEFASKVLLLYREEANHPEGSGWEKVELVVAQNTSAETGVINLRLHQGFPSFDCHTHVHEEASRG